MSVCGWDQSWLLIQACSRGTVQCFSSVSLLLISTYTIQRAGISIQLANKSTSKFLNHFPKERNSRNSTNVGELLYDALSK